LIRGSWDVFEAMWTARNNILHGSDSMLAEAEDNYTNARLLRFRRESAFLLGQADQVHINISEVTILGWNRKKKQKRLRLLERLHKLHVMELKREASRLQPITAFFKPKRGERGSDGAVGAGR
jgi:hypothetical protein